MRYRLGVAIAIGTAVVASAWSGRAADLDHALLRAATDKPAAFDLGLATVYRRRTPAVSPPIWESRTLGSDGNWLAVSEVSVDITPADRAAIFAPQGRDGAPRR
jgi:hypothetical protein